MPSAPGKRFDKDSKVTDMLYACYELAEAGKDFREALEAIRARYREIVSGLELSVDLDGEFGIIEKNFQAKAGRDYAASRGEYLNGIIMAAYLDFEFVDAAEVIRFDGNGSFNAEETKPTIHVPLSSGELVLRILMGMFSWRTGKMDSSWRTPAPM